MARLRFGTSGWDYAEWVGPVYKSASESKLAAYARVFDTAEINSTFYRPPTKGMVLGWVRHTPESFRFAAKVPQTVTHDRLLDVGRGAADELRAYCELMRPLLDAGKLGPLLLQLPPRMRYEPVKLRPFFEALPDRFAFALEPRNKTWMDPEAFETLQTHGVAYCIVDEPLLPPDLRVTDEIAYIRWHGHGSQPWYNYRYSEDELRDWVPKVRDVLSRSEEVYGFFNNHYHGYAPENSLQMLEMLGVELTAAQRGAARRISEHRQGLIGTPTGPVRRVTLDDFGPDPPPAGGGVELELMGLLDKGRLDRARRIAERDVAILSDDDDGLEARVREYVVAVEASSRRIVHDCEDWATQLRIRRFCKHLGRLFLSLPPDRARALLADLKAHRESWTFAIPRE